ncbi:hypothetical protein RB595_004158 [Gaeumannomyces hyphopodioides]
MNNLSPQSGALAALGAALGYLSAEAASTTSIEGLLWPERFYSHFTASHIPALALLGPMGGSLHKRVLEVLDVIFAHGLLRGAGQGHMLGTAFLPSRDWTYTMHGEGGGHVSHTEPLRNCLWPRVLSYMPMPAPERRPDTDASKEGVLIAGRPRPLRARTRVSHLTLSRPRAGDISSDKIPLVSEGVGTPRFRVLLAIVTAETISILTAIMVFLFFNSMWAVLWLLPLLLRLTSAVFALEREPLLDTSFSAAAALEDPCDFEIHCPQSEGSFMLVTGPPTLVLQFFRHYGHPLRNRFRELIQLLAIAVFACLFPVGLLCSVMWMPPPVQYVWLFYQLYAVLAMHALRYSPPACSPTTEAGIAELLKTRAAAPGENAILFGHSREGAETLKASVTVTYHDHYDEAKRCMEKLMHHHGAPQYGLPDRHGLELLDHPVSTP